MAEMRGLIPYIFENKLDEIVIRLELYLEIYGTIKMACEDVVFEQLHIALGDGIFRKLVWMFGKELDVYPVSSKTLFYNRVVQYRDVVFAGKMFSTVDDAGLLVQELCDVAAFLAVG